MSNNLNLNLESKNINDYLRSSPSINYEDTNIKSLGDILAYGTKNQIDLVKKVYEYVRDNISHSFDIDTNVVTRKASEVLEHKHGICFAKAHLFAALLRYLKIPTGFCYQKLILNDETNNSLILHGLNAVYLKDLNKWIRLDARGNKKGVNAEFSLDEEKLAFMIRTKLGEVDYPTIYVNPNANVIQALILNNTIDELINNLPTDL